MLDVRNARALLAERVSPAFIASCYDTLPSPRAVKSHRDELRLRARRPRLGAMSAYLPSLRHCTVPVCNGSFTSNAGVPLAMTVGDRIRP